MADTPAIPDRAALLAAELVFIRHGETTYNEQRLLNGDPTIEVDLSARGREQCEAMRAHLQGIEWAACYVTRFVRTLQSARILLGDEQAAPAVLTDLDDISGGIFEGRPLDDYRDWRRGHGVDEAPPGGESRLDVARRYARGLAWLAVEAPRPALVVTHDQPIRYLENVLLGADPLFGPLEGIANAVPYPHSAAEIGDGAQRMADWIGER